MAEAAEQGTPAQAGKIFLSYARGDDEPFVRRLYEDLTKAGFNVWFDRVSMPSRSLTFHQEIRDAIHVCDRLILVVGPKAVASDYVIQEWQFAYFVENKCVNPIVRLDGGDAQGGRVDGYNLIPEDLRLLHAEDFRDDARFGEHLGNLIRQLSEPLPPVGKLVAVPELPPGYRAQPERLKALRDLLLLDLQKPVVVTGAAARVGLQGMGGIGKSVLANALARHPQVQRAFQDGIYWLGVGQQPRIEELQRRLALALGGDGLFADRQAGKEQLRQLLADRAALLILDDVWERNDAEAFNVAGSRSRILLTTRDAGLVTALASRENHYRVELPTLAEAEAILGGAADVPPDQLPPEAREIIEECGRLPLALALCGGMVGGGSSWGSVVEALREHDLEYLSSEHPGEEQHQNAWKAMDISLRVLERPEQERFAELAVFSPDNGAPDAAVATLWAHTGGLSARQTEALLAKFTRRSLVQRPLAAGGEAAARIDLHDLLHHFATGMAMKNLGSLAALHQRLLDAYRVKCPAGWPGGPNDGYFFQHLASHLAGTGAWPEAEALVTDFPWLMRKCEFGLLDSISWDYASLTKQAPPETRTRLDLWQAFFREKAHILRRQNDEWPAHKILVQLAVEHADDSPLTIAAEQWLAEDRCDWLWLRRVPRLPHAQKNPCLAVLEGHTSGVYGALALADGRLLSWSGDRTLRFWDGESGTPLAVLEGHTDEVNGALALADGRLLSWSKDKTLRLWDGQKGVCLVVLSGHAAQVVGALVLGDGRLLSWSEDKTLRLWDGQRGECLAVLNGHNDRIGGALALADGRLVSWSWDRTLRVWNGQSGACLAVLAGHTGRVWLRKLIEFLMTRELSVLTERFGYFLGALVLKDGRLLSWSCDGTLRVWNGQSGKCLAVLEGHVWVVWGALELPDGRLVSWSKDRTLRVWNAQTGACLRVLEGHTGPVGGVLALPDGWLVSWSEDGTLRVWNAQTGACLRVLEGHTGPVGGVLALPDGRLVSWSLDNTLRIWNEKTGDCLAVLLGHAYPVDGVLALPDGRLVSWSLDNTLRVWNAQSGDRSAVLQGHTAFVGHALELPDGRLVSWSCDGTLRIWNGQTGECLAVLEGHTSSVHDVLSLADGRLVSWSWDKTLRVWNGQTGKCLAVLKGHVDRASGALSLADGRLVSWSKDRTLRVWNAQTGACLRVLEGHTGPVGGVLALADGRLLSWSEDKTLRVWNGQTGKCLAVLKGHVDRVSGALSLADGRLVSWSWDKTLRVWNGQTGKCLAVLEGHTVRVECALSLADGRLVSWSLDETWRVWDSKTGSRLEVVSEDQAARRHPEWLNVRAKAVVYWPWSFGPFFAGSLARTAFLRHKAISSVLAAWNADSGAQVSCGWPDGTAVVTQANGQVCILKLHHGQRRISLAEAESLLPQLHPPLVNAAP